jgi:hypothetical protein
MVLRLQGGGGWGCSAAVLYRLRSAAPRAVHQTVPGGRQQGGRSQGSKAGAATRAATSTSRSAAGLRVCSCPPLPAAQAPAAQHHQPGVHLGSVADLRAQQHAACSRQRSRWASQLAVQLPRGDWEWESDPAPRARRLTIDSPTPLAPPEGLSCTVLTWLLATCMGGAATAPSGFCAHTRQLLPHGAAGCQGPPRSRGQARGAHPSAARQLAHVAQHMLRLAQHLRPLPPELFHVILEGPQHVPLHHLRACGPAQLLRSSCAPCSARAPSRAGQAAGGQGASSRTSAG